MKLETSTISILKHLGGIATSIYIEPDDPQTFVVASDNKSIVALAKNIQPFEKKMPIYSIKSLTSALELFKDTDFALDIHEESVDIVSDDGVFRQTFYLSDPSILLVPKPDKTAAYFEQDVPVEFELTAAFLAKLKDGVTKNNATHVIFEASKGVVSVTAAHVSSAGQLEGGQNKFSVKTEAKSDTDFRAGIPAVVFTSTAPGNYKVGITKNFVRFLAPEDAFVSYVMPTAKWSTLG